MLFVIALGWLLLDRKLQWSPKISNHSIGYLLYGQSIKAVLTTVVLIILMSGFYVMIKPMFDAFNIMDIFFDLLGGFIVAVGVGQIAINLKK